MRIPHAFSSKSLASIHILHVQTIPSPSMQSERKRLGDEGGSGSGLVLERRGELLLLDVVSGQSVDSGLDENHSAIGQGRPSGI
jgi:hypothetical protein